MQVGSPNLYQTPNQHDKNNKWVSPKLLKRQLLLSENVTDQSDNHQYLLCIFVDECTI